MKFRWVEDKRKSETPENIKDDRIKEMTKKQKCEFFINWEVTARKDSLNSKIIIMSD